VTNSTFLTANTILLCTNYLFLIHDSRSLFRIQMCNLLLVHCHWSTCPIQTSYVPRMNLMSIFLSWFRLSRECVQVRVSVKCFVTRLLLRWRFVSPTPNPQVGGPSLVVTTPPPIGGGRSSILNLRTPHAVLTRDPPNMELRSINSEL
jgi:hypothetical protein